MSIKHPVYPAVMLLLLLAACNQNNTENDKLSTLNRSVNETNMQSDSQKIFQQPISEKHTLQTTDSSAQAPAAKTITYTDWDKKIIKTADVKMEVKDFKAFNNNIHQSLKQYGAYVAQEEQNAMEDKTEDVITIKVPVEQFDNLMNQVMATGEKVKEKKINTDDVTAEIFDTKSRLENKKVIRQKYLDIAKNARNTDEIIKAETELDGIQEQIESAAGRVQFLNHQSAYSTIHLTFFQLAADYKPADDNPGFISQLGNAFTTGGSWLGKLLVGLTSVWPLWLGIVAGLWIWKRTVTAKKPMVNK